MTGHDEHEHDHASHSNEPLGGVDPAELRSVVDDLAAALRDYVDTAVGVRAEFGAHEADEDPRILALESRVAGLNASLYDLLHERLGLHSDLTGMTWDDEDEAAPHSRTDTFHLGFVVGPPQGTSDLSMDSVLGIVDDAGEEIAQRLIGSGFDVSEWGTSRGVPVVFDLDEEGDDE